MAQIALPYRIAVGAVLVLVVGFFVLKGKDDSTPKPAPVAPGVAGLTTAIDNAHGAVTTSDAANAAAGGTTDAPATPAPAAAAPSTPATTPAAPAAKGVAAKALTEIAAGDRSAGILREIAAGKTAVVLFSTPGAADDVHVRRALSRVDLHHGAVTVHRVALDDVGTYDAITRGVQITEAPTLLVIGDDLKAHRIVGYTDRTEINQLVNDVSGLRTRLKPSSYTTLVQRGCGTTKYNIEGDGKSLADRNDRVAAFRDDVQALGARLRGATVPAHFGAFNAQYLRYLTDIDRTLAALTPRSPESAYRAAVTRLNQLDNRINAQASGSGLRCAA